MDKTQKFYEPYYKVYYKTIGWRLTLVRAKTWSKWFRQLKWILVREMKKRPWIRYFYPIFQLLIFQKIWIASNKRFEKEQWLLARTAEKAAEYWALYNSDGETDIVFVARPLDKECSHWYAEYIGQAEWKATPLLNAKFIFG